MLYSFLTYYTDFIIPKPKVWNIVVKYNVVT